MNKLFIVHVWKQEEIIRVQFCSQEPDKKEIVDYACEYNLFNERLIMSQDIIEWIAFGILRRSKNVIQFRKVG